MMPASLLDAGSPTFDRVEVTLDGEVREFESKEFMALPLAERIRLILAGSPKFFLSGQEIEKTKALALG